MIKKKEKQHSAPMTLDGLARKVDLLAENTDKKFTAVHQELEKLAVSTAREFQTIRSEMASDRKEILHAIENVDIHLSATTSQWRDEFDGVRDTVKDHEERLKVIEKRHRLAS